MVRSRGSFGIIIIIFDIIPGTSERLARIELVSFERTLVGRRRCSIHRSRAMYDGKSLCFTCIGIALLVGVGIWEDR